MNEIYQYWLSSQKPGEGLTVKQVADHFGIGINLAHKAINKGLSKPKKLTEREKAIISAVQINGPEASTAVIFASLRYRHGLLPREQKTVYPMLTDLVNRGYLERVSAGKYSVKTTKLN